MMTKGILPKPLRGIIPPIVTPLLKNGTLDTEGLERLIEHVIKGGVHGLFILGTTGEAPSLSYKLKKELIKVTCEKVNERIPVFVGITDSSPDESILLAKAAEQDGASGLVVAPPYYFSLSQHELITYFRHIADHAGLPLFLYNIPSQTKIVIEPGSIKNLAAHPMIAGLKDSSGNGTYFSTVSSIMKTDESFALFVGPDEMLASVLLTGAHGGVSAGANLFPKLYVELFDASRAGNINAVSSLHSQVMEISNKIYNGVSTSTSYLKGMKAALSIMGVCDDFMAYPLIPLDQKEKEIIKRNLADFKVNFNL
ncbi:MAG: dihydrodipicolinate synthase family protein [Cyclobacteriaceae bacterium]